VSMSRIFAYAILLMVLRFMTGIVIGIADVFPLCDEVGAHGIRQYWLGYLLGTTLDCLVVMLLFLSLAKSQVRLRWIDVLAIVILQELMGAALDYVIPGDAPLSPHLFLDYFFLLAAIVAGVLIGQRWRMIIENRTSRE
jgi:hypothetical protein